MLVSRHARLDNYMYNVCNKTQPSTKQNNYYVPNTILLKCLHVRFLKRPKEVSVGKNFCDNALGSLRAGRLLFPSARRTTIHRLRFGRSKNFEVKLQMRR